MRNARASTCLERSSGERGGRLAIAKVFTVIFVFYPILSVYAVGALNLAQVMTLPFVVLFVVDSFRMPIIPEPRFAKRFPVALCAFIFALFLFSLLSTLVFYGSADVGRISKISLMIYGLLLLLSAGRYLIPRLAIKVLKIVLVAACLILCVQHLANGVFGIQFQPYLPFLDTVSMEQTGRVLLYEQGGVTVYRPSSVFVEPSHFALFCAFGLGFLLFLENEKRKSDIAILVFVTASMLISTSGTAFVFAGICWVVHFLPKLMSRPLIIVAAALVFLGVAIPILLNNESFLLTVSRLSLDEGSGTLRILSFVPFYESAPSLMKLIGCGIGNMSVAFLNTMPFVSGDGILILESGLLGAAGFFVLMAYMFFADGRRLAPFCLLILLTGLIEQYLYGTYFAYSLAFPLYCSEEKGAV